MRKTIAVLMLSMLAISSFGFIPSLAKADAQMQSLWIRTRAIITHWGDTPVFGWLGAHVRMLNANGTYHEWARAHAVWSENVPRINCTEPPTENITLICYAAHLVNTTDVKLNGTDYDLLITGLWNAVKITTSIYFDENGTFLGYERLFDDVVTGAPGTLRFFGIQRPYEAFMLAIEGIPMLRGIVVAVFIRYVEIKICDVDGNGKVDIIDLVRVARRYRTIPGLPGFDPEADLNLDDAIDLGDLTTLAANIEG